MHPMIIHDFLPPVSGRLPAPMGRLIDRGKTLSFSFEGVTYHGFEGDTVASALMASGVRTLSRSFKYHRPRGVVSLASCEANTLVEVNGVPNVFAEQHRLMNGDVVRAQNYLGSLSFDLNAWIGAFSRLFPVGFYYRRFFKPKGIWRYWEPLIRRMAGLGKVNVTAGHGYFDKAYLFADLAVIGGGPAGLSAAISAARMNKRVLIVTQGAHFGGSLRYRRIDLNAERGKAEADRLVAQLQGFPNVRMLSGAQVEGCFADNWLAIVRGRRLYKARAARVIIATGALEQPVVFHNNDLPGIMYGTAAQKLMRLYGVIPGRRAVVLTANDSGYAVALDLVEAGVHVAAVIDVRSQPPESGFTSTVRTQGIRIEAGATITEAFGRRTVVAVRVEKIEPDRSAAADIGKIDCDLLCMSVGVAPNLALAAHLGASLRYDSEWCMHTPIGLPDSVAVAGAANCCFDFDGAIADGERAAQGGVRDEANRNRDSHIAMTLPHRHGKDFVDFDEDLTVKDVLDTVASGFDDIQLLKRYSTAGMGPSQGRHSSINTIQLAAIARNEDAGAIGTTTFRPPYSGESFGVLAGRGFDPVRRTPMHHRHIDAGAQMMVAGAWIRPAYYRRHGDASAAVAAEVAAVRDGVGLIDVSTLGKLEIRGPDAAEFLNRIYVTGHLKQPVGRARYALATDITGTVSDDGIISRVSEQHYFVTTTTGALETVLRAMYLWNASWRLDVDITNVTAAYAAVNLAGPRSRDVLAKVCQDIDIKSEKFPYMAFRTAHLSGAPVRIMRVGFVGELGYEIHIPASCGAFVWDQLIEAGKSWEITPFGVEAQRLLRLEKGHIIVGQDTDGLTNVLEIGMGGNALAKPFFIGHAALKTFAGRPASRKLVAFRMEKDGSLPKEYHLVIDNGGIAGHVTSCARSAAADAIIGLAYVRPHQAEPGTTFTIRIDQGGLVPAQVTNAPFYDPANERQKL
jgi:sarcosine oxidase, subunit alpha